MFDFWGTNRLLSSSLFVYKIIIKIQKQMSIYFYFFVKSMKKLSFTMIEILIVIWIIWLIFGMSLNISNKPITDTKKNYEKNQIVDNFNQIINKNLNSKWRNNEQYEKLEIKISSWNSSIDLFYITDDKQKNWQDRIDLWDFKIYTTQDIILDIRPYNIWCKIYKNLEEGLGLTWINFFVSSDGYRYDFELSSSDCKIR